MGWIPIADNFFRVRDWLFFALAFFYLVPFLRLFALRSKNHSGVVASINKFFGTIEHVVWPVRDILIAPYLVLGAAWHVFRFVQTGDLKDLVIAAFALALIALGFFMRAQRKKSVTSLLKFTAANSVIHPREFFSYLLCSYGPVRQDLPASPLVPISPVSMDFRDSRRNRPAGIFRLLIGAWSTIVCAQLVKKEPKAASGIAFVWGSNLARLSNLAVTAQNMDLLPKTHGPQIFAFTHKSFFDFAFVPFILQGRLPIFLLARDHFKDNLFLYKILGLGRAAEEMGMIFVDRKAPKIEEAVRISRLAAEKLVNSKQLIAIFPQGGRAMPFFGTKDERMDAGYYTAGFKNRVAADGKHLKKGTVHIAIHAAKFLLEKGELENVNIIPVAVFETATACPRGSMKIMPNVHVQIKIAPPVVVTPSEVAKIKMDEGTEYQSLVDNIHKKLDDVLISASRIDAICEHRFFEDLRLMLDPMKLEEVAVAMRSWRGDDHLIYAIMDIIYSMRRAQQITAIRELAHLILEFATREDLLAFRVKLVSELK